MPSARRSIVRARELRRVGPLGERLGRRLQVGRSIATHRPPERMSGRASLARRAMSAAVSSTSSNTADQRTFGELVRADHRLRRRVDEHAQRRRRLAPRQRRHPHVEAGASSTRPGGRHQLPGLVLAQDDLAAPRAARAQQTRAASVRGARSRLRDAARPAPALTIACSIGSRLARGARREHREVPHVAVVGRIEPDDQRCALAA